MWPLQTLEALPDAYVGTDIAPVVRFLCTELAAAFEVSTEALKCKRCVPYTGTG